MAQAFQLAGAGTKIVTINDLASGKVSLAHADLIGLAGGFSYGDHFRSGAFAANDLLTVLGSELREVCRMGIPILGVCNGFQILIEAGLLPGDAEIGRTTAVLDRNTSTRFEHWSEVPLCFHSLANTDCVWTKGLDGASFTLPVAHGEGRLVPETSKSYNVVATYGTTPEGDVSKSPNGSVIAGICSADGLVMGMMPHPERRIDKLRGGNQGLEIFRAGVLAVL